LKKSSRYFDEPDELDARPSWWSERIFDIDVYDGTFTSSNELVAFRNYLRESTYHEKRCG
jgi:hypothetical protein